MSVGMYGKLTTFRLSIKPLKYRGAPIIYTIKFNFTEAERLHCKLPF